MDRGLFVADKMMGDVPGGSQIFVNRIDSRTGNTECINNPFMLQNFHDSLSALHVLLLGNFII